MEDNEKKSENSEVFTLKIKKDSMWKYSTFVLAALLVVGGFMFFTRGNVTTTGNVVANQPGQQLPPTTGKVEVKIGDSPVLGKENAPVTIVEFSDYQCPYCGRHFTDTYGQIKKNYIDTGKVKLVFKDFPLSFHPEAQKAAEAARCVREQKNVDGYWKMHDKLFSNQQSLSVENEKKWARELGVDGAKFDSCLDSGKFAQAVRDDLSYGSTIGVSGTPGFFINGVSLVGAQPFGAFQQAIEAELAK